MKRIAIWDFKSSLDEKVQARVDFSCSDLKLKNDFQGAKSIEYTFFFHKHDEAYNNKCVTVYEKFGGLSIDALSRKLDALLLEHFPLESDEKTSLQIEIDDKPVPPGNAEK